MLPGNIPLLWFNLHACMISGLCQLHFLVGVAQAGRTSAALSGDCNVQQPNTIHRSLIHIISLDLVANQYYY